MALLSKRSAVHSFMRRIQKHDAFFSGQFPWVCRRRHLLPSKAAAAASAFLSTAAGGADEEAEELKAKYESFLVEHKKFDYTPKEKKKRFEIFKNTVRFIDHHNSTSPSWSKLALNYSADLAKKEICNVAKIQLPLFTPPPMAMEEEEDPLPCWDELTGETPVMDQEHIDAIDAWFLHRAAVEDLDLDQDQDQDQAQELPLANYTPRPLVLVLDDDDDEEEETKIKI